MVVQLHRSTCFDTFHLATVEIHTFSFVIAKRKLTWVSNHFLFQCFAQSKRVHGCKAIFCIGQLGLAPSTLHFHNQKYGHIRGPQVQKYRHTTVASGPQPAQTPPGKTLHEWPLAELAIVNGNSQNKQGMSQKTRPILITTKLDPIPDVSRGVWWDEVGCVCVCVLPSSKFLS